MIETLLSYVPWWAWAGGGVGAVVLAYRFLGLRGALTAGAGLLGLVAYRKGRDDQRARQKQDALEQHYRDMETRHEVEEINRNRTPDERRDQLRNRWSKP